MEYRTVQKILNTQELALQDPYYLTLIEEYQLRSAALLRLLDSLPQEDAAVIEDYLGLTAQMHRKLLEIACT